MNWKKVLGSSVLSLMLLAGCSGGQEGKTTEPNESTKQPTTTEQTAYKVGITQFVEHPSLTVATDGFKKALGDAGLKVTYDEQIAQGDPNNNLTIANNLVGNQVDLIFANSTPSAQSALNATKDLPIIFTSVTDPVDAGLVESMDKPGKNITGTTDTHPDAIPNTIAFINKYFDGNRVGMIYNAGEPNSVAQIDLVKKAMEGTDLKVVERSVSTSAEVKQATESLVGAVDVIYIITDNTVVQALESVISVANENDIPLFAGELDSVGRGAFAAYGFDYYNIGYEAGQMAVQILKGEKTPADLPVQYPQNLNLLINRKAAKEMGIKINPEWEGIAEFTE